MLNDNWKLVITQRAPYNISIYAIGADINTSFITCNSISFDSGRRFRIVVLNLSVFFFNSMGNDFRMWAAVVLLTTHLADSPTVLRFQHFLILILAPRVF